MRVKVRRMPLREMRWRCPVPVTRRSFGPRVRTRTPADRERPNAAASRAAMASWLLRGSEVPSAATLTFPRSGRFWPTGSSSVGASPSRFRGGRRRRVPPFPRQGRTGICARPAGLATNLAGVPLDPDRGAGDRQVSGLAETRPALLTDKGERCCNSVPQPITAWPSPAKRGRLSTNPVVCETTLSTCADSLVGSSNRTHPQGSAMPVAAVADPASCRYAVRRPVRQRRARAAAHRADTPLPCPPAGARPLAPVTPFRGRSPGRGRPLGGRCWPCGPVLRARFGRSG